MTEIAGGPAPDASLIVIAFNEEKRISACLQSILEQDAPAAFVVIVVDDGSSDGTRQVVLAAARGEQRVRLVTLPKNVGRGAARAAGVSQARGRAIGFVDADITLPSDWLSRCLAELPGHAAVGGTPVPDGNVAILAKFSGSTPRVVEGGMPITGSNVLFDASVFRAIGFDPRDRVGEDFRLAARLQRAGYALKRIPNLLVGHEEDKTYRAGLRWRYINGVDASTHPRELRVLRIPDYAFAAWGLSWLAAILLSVTVTPWALLVGLGTSVAGGALHAARSFERRPLGPFLLACIANVPLLNAYMLGRVVGLPRLVTGRRYAAAK